MEPEVCRSPLRGSERRLALADERRRRPSRAVRRDRLHEVGEHTFALQPAGLNYREDPFRESGAPLTARAETPLPPEDAPPQDPLRMVVGRLDAFATQEGPERRLQVQEVLAKSRRLLICGLQPAFQQDLEILPDPSHRMLQSGPIDVPRL